MITGQTDQQTDKQERCLTSQMEMGLKLSLGFRVLVLWIGLVNLIPLFALGIGALAADKNLSI